MERLTEVKRRMRRIEEIQGVARTMATVAAAKLSRARERATGMRTYAERMRGILRRQQRCLARSGVSLDDVSPFFVTRENGRILLVHLGGDRGMCGSHNNVINRLALDSIDSWRAAGVGVVVSVIGAKAENYLRRRGGELEIASAGTWPRGGVSDDLVDTLLEQITSSFLDGRTGEVWCAYTRFFSPMRREAVLMRLLPIAPEAAGDLGRGESSADGDDAERWIYEPDRTCVLDELIRAFVRMQCEDVLIESYASEQAARMITMEEATERASKRLHECRVLYNRLRREFITTDLLSVLFASQVRAGKAAAVGSKADAATGDPDAD